MTALHRDEARYPIWRHPRPRYPLAWWPGLPCESCGGTRAFTLVERVRFTGGADRDPPFGRRDDAVPVGEGEAWIALCPDCFLEKVESGAIVATTPHAGEPRPGPRLRA